LWPSAGGLPALVRFGLVHAKSSHKSEEESTMPLKKYGVLIARATDRR
jgi:hypothetical protein